MGVQYQSRGMPFTSEQMKQVFDTNLIDFAVQNGFQIEKGDRNTVHVKNSGGLYFFNSGKGFYCFSTEQKGNIVDFVKEYFGLDFKGAVEMILNCKAYEQTEHVVTPVDKKQKGDLVLPVRDTENRQTMAYLVKTRGIDEEIVTAMISQGKLYQSKQVRDGKTYRNCTFVGYDETGKPRYCAMRSPFPGSNFRQDMDNSDKSYGFVMEGYSKRVYEFESPIDAMSHASLCKLYGIDWRADYRVSEGCLSDKALSRFLKLHPDVEEIVFCYDNDVDGKMADGTAHNHGQEKAVCNAKIYEQIGYKTYIQTPQNKDFNLDLQLYWQVEKRRIKEFMTISEQESEQEI